MVAVAAAVVVVHCWPRLMQRQSLLTFHQAYSVLGVTG